MPAQHATASFFALVASLTSAAAQESLSFSLENRRTATAAPAAAAREQALAWLAARQHEDGHWGARSFIRFEQSGEPSQGLGNPEHDALVTASACLAFLAAGCGFDDERYGGVLGAAADWLSAEGLSEADGRPQLPEALQSRPFVAAALIECALAGHQGSEEVASGMLQDPGSANAGAGWAALRDLETRLLAVDLGLHGDSTPEPPAASRPAGVAPSAHHQFMIHLAGGDVPAATLEQLLVRDYRWNSSADGFDVLDWGYGIAILDLLDPRVAAQERGRLERVLCAAQRQDGNARGSWDPVGEELAAAGRVHATALAVQLLSTAGRYRLETPDSLAERAGYGLPSPLGTRTPATADDPRGQAVLDAQNWLLAHQSTGGSWSPARFDMDEAGDKSGGHGNPLHELGVTGLAILALLADGWPATDSETDHALQRALDWICRQQVLTDGPLKGRMGSWSSGDAVYDHSIATLALLEAWSLGGIERYRAHAQLGLDYLQEHRNPGSVWRYQVQDGEADLSVTAWAAMALRLGWNLGLEVDADAFADVLRFVSDMTDPLSGRSGYFERGGRSSRRSEEHARRFPVEHCEAMTGAGLALRLLLGARTDRERSLALQETLLLAQPPRWEPEMGTIDLYAWHFASLALALSGTDPARTWLGTLEEVLLDAQCDAGNRLGSWDPLGAWGEQGGRVYATAMAVLCLEAGHRYPVPEQWSPVPADRQDLSKLRAAWQKRDFRKFERELGKVTWQDPADGGLKRRIEREFAEQVRLAESHLQAIQDYPRLHWTQDALERLLDEFGTLEVGKQARSALRKMKRSATTQKEVRAGREFEELEQAYAAKEMDFARFESDCKRFLKQFAGTSYIDRVEQMLIEARARNRQGGL